ncbi:hypothetical protein E2C01_062660 [Portunus trituberculatus]|uniref:Uncharacterized protein n=1 Tax=Portunus trituberculatus TaxID=210409 RepID=A0A5B7HHX9_PORTR|nr:hypothetical protein [Portunus trituberculatus]
MRGGTGLRGHCKGLTNHYLKKSYFKHNTKIQYARQSTAWTRLARYNQGPRNRRATYEAFKMGLISRPPGDKARLQFHGSPDTSSADDRLPVFA